MHLTVDCSILEAKIGIKKNNVSIKNLKKHGKMVILSLSSLRNVIYKFKTQSTSFKTIRA